MRLPLYVAFAFRRKFFFICRPANQGHYPQVAFLNYKDRRRILISGGAGFVGSHLVDKLMLEGHEVIVTDNYFTGRKRNVEHWLGHPNFELIIHDIVNPLYIEVKHASLIIH